VSLLSIVQTSFSSAFWVLTNWENTACHSKIVAARDDDASSSGSSFFFFFPCLFDVSVKNPQSTANQSASFLPSFLPSFYRRSMIVIKENVERIYEKLSKIASAKERKINKKQYLLTQLFEDFFSEREREKEQKLKSAKAFW
jgi:hypothetical protein